MWPLRGQSLRRALQVKPSVMRAYQWNQATAMTTAEFMAFAKANEPWFRGRLPESEATLAAAEATLGVKLPQSLRWLLQGWGYWHGTAVSSLSDTVRDTIEARRVHGLPGEFIILENFHDGGLILVDTRDEPSPGEPALFWIGMEDLGENPRLEGNQRWVSYGEYVVEMLETTRDVIPEGDVRYDRSQYPEGRDA